MHRCEECSGRVRLVVHLMLVRPSAIGCGDSGGVDRDQSAQSAASGSKRESRRDAGPQYSTNARTLMQRDGAVLGMVLRIFLRVIEQSLQSLSPGAAQVTKANEAALHIGAVAFIHRFSSDIT